MATSWTRLATESALTTTVRATWWRQVFDIVDGALEIPPRERQDYVIRACAGAPDLAAAATSLLENGEALDFLERPATEFFAPLLEDLASDVSDTLIGTRIGSYRIIREIGQGGMGTVYLAERSDDEYERQVALKVLPAWSAGNKRLVRRFREERQILAALEHPDIARLFDGGLTDDGRPWFAMEYVDGLPIDRFCDAHKLPLERRLELFCRVCDAVEHAHRNLVVHRDLKPANILVTAGGQVKLLDFGIAKLLGKDSAGAAASLTLTGERLMTPMYASPEQVRGEPISTASDVYSLGVLLYELLTGRLPYRLESTEPHGIAQAILEQEPERPSVAVKRAETSSGIGAVHPPDDPAHLRGLSTAKLARRLSGDLDTVVLTAMHKDVAGRYGTPAQLEADVRRYLGGHPLTVRPESALSRARKFVKRHRIGVSIAAGVMLLILGFASLTAVQALRIRAQGARVAVERDRAEQVSRFLAGLLQTSDPYKGGNDEVTTREILDSGAVRIDRGELAERPEARAQLMFVMGQAYFGIGSRDRARRLLEVSLALRRRTNPGDSMEIARTLDALGVVRLERGDLDGAERAHREALALRGDLAGAQGWETARSLNGLAGVLRAAGRFSAADSISRRAVAITENQAEANPGELAESLRGLAHALHERGQHAEAARLYQRALSIRANELGADHPIALATLLDLASALGDAGDAARADSMFRHGLALERNLLGPDHPEVASAEARHARLLQRQGSTAEAEILYRRALATARRRLPAGHDLTSTILVGLGKLMLDRGLADRAERPLREALALRRTTLLPGHPRITEAQQAVGAVILARGRRVEAQRYLVAARSPAMAAGGAGAPTVSAASAVNRRADGSVGDPDIIAVFPFVVGESQPALLDLRDAIQDMISAKLPGGDGAPRALDPAVIRNGPRASRRLPGAHVPLDVALIEARRAGAGLLLHGDVSGTPAELAIAGVIVAVPGGEILAHARVEGSADHFPALAEGLVARLLATRLARDSEELTSLTGATPAALRAYLAGVHAMRRGRVGVSSLATEHFERALFLDSTFAVAALRLAEIASSSGTSELDELWKFDVAWAQRHRLSHADQALLLAYIGPRYPRPATLVELVRAGENAAVAAPNRSEALHIAGELLVRFGSKIGYADWEPRAHAAFTRAHALDSANSGTLAYLMLLAARAGDTASMQRYASRHSAQNPVDRQAQFTEFYRWMAAITLGDSAGIVAVRSRFSDMTQGSLRALLDWSQASGLGLGDAERAAELFDERAPARRPVMMAIVPFLLNRGRPAAASRLLATADQGFGQRADVGILEFRVYAALYWDADSTEAAAAARLLEGYVDGARLPPGHARDPQTAHCALAHWRLAAGDPEGASLALARMRRRGASAAAQPIDLARFCTATVEALLANAHNRPGAAAALQRLDALLREGADVQLLAPTIGIVVAARLHERRGNLREALELTQRRAPFWNQLLSTQLRDEGRLAALVGERDAAIRAYRHYLALRSEPEAAVRPDVERVRVELARLESSADSAARAHPDVVATSSVGTTRREVQ